MQVLIKSIIQDDFHCLYFYLFIYVLQHYGMEFGKKCVKIMSQWKQSLDNLFYFDCEVKNDRSFFIRFTHKADFEMDSGSTFKHSQTTPQYFLF